MTDTAKDTAFVVHPIFTTIPVPQRSDADQAMEEAVGLVAAINMPVVDSMFVNVSRIHPGRFVGAGTLENIKEQIQEHDPQVLVMNHTLSPVQQRNLEKELKVKVIDRTGLILEIFGERAQTKEGRIQVELAQLNYQRSRLVKAWSHLERQRGGTSFVGGPGESQLEIDRRLIDERIVRLKKHLEKVRKTRDLGRQAREKVPFPVIALVGYTNAGKSTLFNHLTKANVFAQDLLFATLDPTMRRITLPSGREVILSDTVGFISDLPTHLIDAFRATLEQTKYADVILHVRDTTQNDYDRHKDDVVKIMGDLDINYENSIHIFEVLNKIDICNEARCNEIERVANFEDNIITISAVTGEGVDVLLDTIDNFLSRHSSMVAYNVPVQDGKAMAWLHQHAEVIEQEEGADSIQILVHIDPANQNRFEGLFPYAPHQS